MAASGQPGAGATAAGLPAPPPKGAAGALRLSRRAKHGEQEAFAEIFRRHHQELYRYCLAIVRDRDDAEDALQATMASALHSLPGESREIAVRPWLFRIAHNESVSLLRKRRDGVATGEDLTDRAATQASQEEELATRDRLRSLVADLGELPDRQCSAIVMRELSGLSYAEIAAALSCSDGGARQAVYEARMALREREEGRDMGCEQVRAAISDRDGRRLRGRKLRAHLKGCDGCRGFAASISRRRSDLELLCPPLPAAAAGTMLAGLVGGGGGAAAGGAAGVAGAAGGGLAASAALKGGSIVAAVAIAAGAADVGGLVDLPSPLGSGGGKAEPAASNPGSGGDAATAGAAATAAGGEGGAAASAADGRSGRVDRSDGGGRNGDGRAQSDAGTGGGNGSGGGAAAPGQSGSAPAGGQAGSPGDSVAAPGHTGGNPGGGTTTAPGQTGSAGNSAGAPGHTTTPTPGQTGPVGNSAAAPGQTGSTPAATGTAGEGAGSKGAGSKGSSSK